MRLCGARPGLVKRGAVQAAQSRGLRAYDEGGLRRSGHDEGARAQQLKAQRRGVRGRRIEGQLSAPAFTSGLEGGGVRGGGIKGQLSAPAVQLRP